MKQSLNTESEAPKVEFTPQESAVLTKYQDAWRPTVMDVPTKDGYHTGIFGVADTNDFADTQILVDALRKKGLNCIIKYETKGIIGATTNDLRNKKGMPGTGFIPNLIDILGDSIIQTNLNLKKEMEQDPKELLTNLSLQVIAPEDQLNKAGYKTKAKIVI